MNIPSALEAPLVIREGQGLGHWHRRVVRRADLVGSLVFVTPLLLGAYLSTRLPLLQSVMYGLCVLAVLPHLGPFLASLRRNPANLLLVLLFGTLALSTGAAFLRQPSTGAILQAKALAATAAWASIYVVVFSSLRGVSGVLRLMKWIRAVCIVIAVSVYLSVLFHAFGIRFGEVLEFRDGGIRAFGPLGDQVGFILVLPALISLVASRPLMFGVYLGALFLTATRGAVLCLIVGVMAYLLALASGKVRSGRRRIVWSAMAVAVGGLVWLTPAATMLTDRVWESPDAPDYSFRLTAVETGVTVLLANPLLGLGFNGFAAGRPALYEDWLTPERAASGLGRAANQYLQTATDGGVVALVLLVLFVLSTGRNALRVAIWPRATPELLASQLWLVSVVVGNQGALWLLSNTGSGFFLFAVAGMAARMRLILAGERARRRAFLKS